MSKRIDNYERIPEDFFLLVEQAQAQVIDALESLLGELEKSGGKFNANAQNIASIEAEIKRIRDDILFKGKYLEGLKDFGRGLAQQRNLINNALTDVFGELDFGAYKDVWNRSVGIILDNLGQSGIDTGFINPLRQQLQSAVDLGADFRDTVKGLREFIEGTAEQNGLLLRYVKQVARDGFSFADRKYGQFIADDLGAEWFRYTGGTVKDSREFCMERNGGIFHVEEIRAWGNGEMTIGMQWPQGGRWQGMAAGTNAATIFTYLGGYNCFHSLIPILEPGEGDIRRAEAQGFI